MTEEVYQTRDEQCEELARIVEDYFAVKLPKEKRAEHMIGFLLEHTGRIEGTPFSLPIGLSDDAGYMIPCKHHGYLFLVAVGESKGQVSVREDGQFYDAPISKEASKIAFKEMEELRKR